MIDTTLALLGIAGAMTIDIRGRDHFYALEYQLDAHAPAGGQQA